MSETPLTPKQRAEQLRQKLHICDLAAAQFIVAQEQLEKDFPEWKEEHEDAYSNPLCSAIIKETWEVDRSSIIKLISNLEKS